MYIDPGADTSEGYGIAYTSRKLAREMVGDETPHDRIRQRCSVSVGDFAMAELMRFVQDPTEAGVTAIRKGAPIYTDIRMVQVGILKKGHTCRIECALDYGAELAASSGITRTSAGFLMLGERLAGSIVVIGNAPSALLSVCRLIEEGIIPALVIGTPVGFVNAAESKELLRTMLVPSVSNTGTRGGTPVAVAAMNEIIILSLERP
ncbi:MAG: precorrin-8X methylmutase [Methanocalculus sp. MSAO_Arc2]|uniref:precorrin-8X methylmutase n=1 Tax=Methanocalculus sp. MSAO_Arc2 TaxID=2293855 RepID=UPI000FF2AAD3|nr:MAG: precorrin-8X methylmutase [Methanocalculus sp. MSAO_Arc2]